MFKVATFDNLSDLGDELNQCCGAGGVLFLVSYVVVSPSRPRIRVGTAPAATRPRGLRAAAPESVGARRRSDIFEQARAETRTAWAAELVAAMERAVRAADAADAGCVG